MWCLALYCDTLLSLAIERYYACCVSAWITAALSLTKKNETIVPHYFLAGPCSCRATAAVSRMVESPIAGRVSRHQRVASHFALRLMRVLRSTTVADITAARNRRRSFRRRRASARLLRDHKEYFGLTNYNIRHHSFYYRSLCCHSISRLSTGRWWLLL